MLRNFPVLLLFYFSLFTFLLCAALDGNIAVCVECFRFQTRKRRNRTDFSFAACVNSRNLTPDSELSSNLKAQSSVCRVKSQSVNNIITVWQITAAWQIT